MSNITTATIDPVLVQLIEAEGPSVTLRPIAMVRPNDRGVYAPSRVRQSKTISQADFFSKYADHPQVIPVSYAEDGISNPEAILAYGFGLDCWYIVGG